MHRKRGGPFGHSLLTHCCPRQSDHPNQESSIKTSKASKLISCSRLTAAAGRSISLHLQNPSPAHASLPPLHFSSPSEPISCSSRIKYQNFKSFKTHLLLTPHCRRSSASLPPLHFSSSSEPISCSRRHGITLFTASRIHGITAIRHHGITVRNNISHYLLSVLVCSELGCSECWLFESVFCR